MPESKPRVSRKSAKETRNYEKCITNQQITMPLGVCYGVCKQSPQTPPAPGKRLKYAGNSQESCSQPSRVAPGEQYGRCPALEWRANLQHCFLPCAANTCRAGPQSSNMSHEPKCITPGLTLSNFLGQMLVSKLVQLPRACRPTNLGGFPRKTGFSISKLPAKSCESSGKLCCQLCR